MALRWSVAALCCGLLALTAAGEAVQAADEKLPADKNVNPSDGSVKASGEKDAKAGEKAKNGNGKNGNGRYAVTVQTRPAAAGHEARIQVYVPVPEARLWVEDLLTRATGLERSFRLPARDRDRTYSYQMKAEWTDPDGHAVQRKVRVDFRGREDVIVDFR